MQIRLQKKTKGLLDEFVKFAESSETKTLSDAKKTEKLGQQINKLEDGKEKSATNLINFNPGGIIEGYQLINESRAGLFFNHY